MAGGTSVLALLLLCSACTLGFPQVGEVSMLEEHVEQAAPHVEAADRRAMRNSEVKTSTDKDAEKAASADAEEIPITALDQTYHELASAMTTLKSTMPKKVESTTEAQIERESERQIEKDKEEAQKEASLPEDVAASGKPEVNLLEVYGYVNSAMEDLKKQIHSKVPLNLGKAEGKAQEKFSNELDNISKAKMDEERKFEGGETPGDPNSVEDQLKTEAAEASVDAAEVDTEAEQSQSREQADAKNAAAPEAPEAEAESGKAESNAPEDAQGGKGGKGGKGMPDGEMEKNGDMEFDAAGGKGGKGGQMEHESAHEEGAGYGEGGKGGKGAQKAPESAHEGAGYGEGGKGGKGGKGAQKAPDGTGNGYGEGGKGGKGETPPKIP